MHAPPSAPAQWLTPEEFAELAGISRAHCFNLIRRGQIRSAKLGRSRRIPAAALDELCSGGTPSRQADDVETAVEL